jgi:hypothetical protein
MALIPLFPSPEYAAGRAGTDTALAYDRLGEAEMRRIQGMGINPASARFNGLRQSLALKKAAAVSGAKTRAANAARESAISRMMQLISLGQRGLLQPQTATRIPGSGSSSIGRSRGIRPLGMGLAEWNESQKPPAPPASPAPAAKPQAAAPAAPAAPAVPAPAAAPALVPSTQPPAPQRQATRPVVQTRQGFGTGIFLNGQEQPVPETRAPGVYLGGVRQGYTPIQAPAALPSLESAGRSMAESLRPSWASGLGLLDMTGPSEDDSLSW